MRWWINSLNLRQLSAIQTAFIASFSRVLSTAMWRNVLNDRFIFMTAPADGRSATSMRKHKLFRYFYPPVILLKHCSIQQIKSCHAFLTTIWINKLFRLKRQENGFVCFVLCMRRQRDMKKPVLLDQYGLGAKQLLSQWLGESQLTAAGPIMSHAGTGSWVQYSCMYVTRVRADGKSKLNSGLLLMTMINDLIWHLWKTLIVRVSVFIICYVI